MKQQHRVVIIGGNFGGLSAAAELPKDYRVTLIDPSPYVEFLPNIHELLSGIKTPAHLRLPRRRLIERMGHRFERDTVNNIDTESNTVTTASGKHLPYDACIVAIGGINNDRQISGASEHALAFKCVDDCAAIGQRLHTLTRNSRPASVVIVGAGLEGVEAMGEILRRYRNHRHLQLHLVDSGERLMPTAPAALARAIESQCKPLGVSFHYNSRVQAVYPDRVQLSSGDTLQADATIWTGGAKPPPLLYQAGLAHTEHSWAAVGTDLRSHANEQIFVIGDAADLAQPVSKQAYHAMEMGKCAAHNARRALRGARLQSFKAGPELSLLSLGDLNTYLLYGDKALTGTALASGKEAIYQLNMAKLDPPTGLSSLYRLQQRSLNSVTQLGLPTLRSPAALLALGELSLLR